MLLELILEQSQDFLKTKFRRQFFTRYFFGILKHVYMRPEVNSNRFEIKTALKCRSVYMAISLQATLKAQIAFKNCPVYMEISLRQLSKP